VGAFLVSTSIPTPETDVAAASSPPVSGVTPTSQAEGVPGEAADRVQREPGPPTTTLADETPTSTLVEEDDGPDGPEDQSPGVQPIVPDPILAAEDVPIIYTSDIKCHRGHPATDPPPDPCEFGLDSAEHVVVLVGDSHAAQWFPALAELSDVLDFRLRVFTKSNCPLVSVTVAAGDPEREYVECDEWNEKLIERLIHEDRPDLVVTSNAYWYTVVDRGEFVAYEGAQNLLAQGLATSWLRLSDAGIPVLPILDTPPPLISGLRVAECVVENRQSPGDCAFDREAAMSANTSQMTASELTGLPLVETTAWICGETLCPAVVDGILVWRDLHHLTATFAEHLAPELGPFVAEALGKAWPLAASS
jgi:hypothetical protein